MKHGIRALRDRVIVRDLPLAEKTEGGIFLPDKTRDLPIRGRVLAVGEGRWTESGVNIPVGVEVGDIVYYAKYAGSELQVQGKHFKVLRSDELVGADFESVKVPKGAWCFEDDVPEEKPEPVEAVA